MHVQECRVGNNAAALVLHVCAAKDAARWAAACCAWRGPGAESTPRMCLRTPVHSSLLPPAAQGGETCTVNTLFHAQLDSALHLSELVPWPKHIRQPAVGM